VDVRSRRDLPALSLDLDEEARELDLDSPITSEKRIFPLGLRDITRVPGSR
jgi:hypothetical protein